MRCPGVPVAAAEVEELEGALGARAGGYVAAECQRSSCDLCESMLIESLHVRNVTGHDEAVVADQRFTGGADSFLAVLCERDVRYACVSAVERPFCLAVTDDEDAWVGHGGINARTEGSIGGNALRSRVSRRLDLRETSVYQ